jgi:hypothetical protein
MLEVSSIEVMLIILYSDTNRRPRTEFRKNWKCSWCLMSGRFTPTLRRGPLGTRTVCNACGIWYAKYNNMPEDRYREFADAVDV